MDDSDPVDAAVVRLIRAARKEAKVPQGRLAEAVGVSRATINALEQGKASVTVGRLYRIAAALDVPVGDLLPTNDTPRASQTVVPRAIEYVERIRDDAASLDRLLSVLAVGDGNA